MIGHAIAPGYRASHLIRDAEAMGLLRHVRATVGCPSCGADVRLDLETCAIACKRCGTTTHLCRFIDGEADRLMQTAPIVAREEADDGIA